VRIRAAQNDAEIASLRLQALKDAYRILALNFGIPPTQFKWRYEDKDKKLTPFATYTPQQFYHEVVNDALDDYLALYSIPTLPFYKRYEIDLDKAVEDRPNMNFVNCPLDTLKGLAKACLLDNRPVWFGCAVEQESVRDRGLMMPESTTTSPCTTWTCSCRERSSSRRTPAPRTTTWSSPGST